MEDSIATGEAVEEADNCKDCEDKKSMTADSANEMYDGPPAAKEVEPV